METMGTTGRTRYARQGELVEGLMDLHARVMERHRQDRAELRRLTGLALWMEAQLRADGNPDAVMRELANMATSEGATSEAAD
jgi:hypothetical protein